MKDVEIVVFNDKSWVRLTKYQKVKVENIRLKALIEKMRQDVSDMKYFTSFGTVSNACKELLSKWELAE